MAEVEIEKIAEEDGGGEEEIVLYTIGCPQCNALERKLKEKNISFVCKNISEDEEALTKLYALGFEHVPVLQVGNEFMKYKQALMWIGGYNA